MDFRLITYIFLVIFVTRIQNSAEHDQGISIPNIPLEHYVYWMRNNPSLLKLIGPLCKGRVSENLQNISFIFEDHQIGKSPSETIHWLQYICDRREIISTSCWGYEHGCDTVYSSPKCPSSSKGWTTNKAEQRKTFFNQADFGYIRERRSELYSICTPLKSDSSSIASSLECISHLRFCRAKYFRLDLKKLLSPDVDPMRYRMDILEPGQINGWNCKLNSKALTKESDHKSPLQSWAPELEHFSIINTREDAVPTQDTWNGGCDITFERPTILMKLDATVNMYHHFCDFVNLYATLHLNGSLSSEIDILIWDTVPYRSNFSPMWDAFTRHPIRDLSSLRGKRVCFQNLILPLLPRMVYGLYYNMPLIEGCHSSGLFKAFNRHILHRLSIPVRHPASGESTVRITLISRKTKYRQILNEEELIAGLRHSKDPHLRNVQINRVSFSREILFKRQLEIVQNSDILVGMHGAGLTHALFLPDWGVLYEMYNCGDVNCYRDLARLRGVRYMTWRDKDRGLFPQDNGTHPELGAHEKFTNYEFDTIMFLRQIKKAVKYVLSVRPSFASVSSQDDAKYSEPKLNVEENPESPIVRRQIRSEL